MTGQHRFSAPGKAVLSGEYAVLRGAPAVSLALDRRAVVTRCMTGGPVSTVRVPGHAFGEWRFELADTGQIAWLDAPPEQGLRLVEAALEACGVSPDRHSDITIDTRAFRDAGSGMKLGLGSSAAAVTALVMALLPPQHSLADCLSMARHVHRTLQHDRGSGVDVVTSCAGGLILFRQGDDSLPTRLAWPAGLSCRFFFSGRSANTTAAIDRLEAVAHAREAWAPLTSAADASAEAWLSLDAGRIVEASRDYAAALRRFSDGLDLGIFGAGHAVLADIATSQSLIYKPCGAGGGDIGVALALCGTTLDAFSASAAEAGFLPLEVALDNDGVRDDTGESG